MFGNVKPRMLRKVKGKGNESVIQKDHTQLAEQAEADRQRVKAVRQAEQAETDKPVVHHGDWRPPGSRPFDPSPPRPTGNVLIV